MKSVKLNAIIAGNISQVIRNKTIRANTSSFINSEGKGFHVLNDEVIPDKEFFEMYPVELLPVRSKGENPDRTKEYFYNKKSY